VRRGLAIPPRLLPLQGPARSRAMRAHLGVSGIFIERILTPTARACY